MKKGVFNLKLLFEGQPIVRSRFNNVKEIEKLLKGLKEKFK